MQTASPFPLEQPQNAMEVIGPAVDGTLRALKAAQAAGVSRVILTSSVAAIMYRDKPAGALYSSADWTDGDNTSLTPYIRSKALAEKAAWDFIAKDAPDMRLTVINPGFVLGPPLGGVDGTSMTVIARVLKAQDPMQPPVSFPIVDVRDVAARHVAALADDSTIGQRIIAANETASFADIARILQPISPKRLKTREAPVWLIRALALFDSLIKAVLPDLGKTRQMDTTPARTLLGRDLISADMSIREAGERVLKTL